MNKICAVLTAFLMLAGITAHAQELQVDFVRNLIADLPLKNNRHVQTIINVLPNQLDKSPRPKSEFDMITIDPSVEDIIAHESLNDILEDTNANEVSLSTLIDPDEKDSSQARIYFLLNNNFKNLRTNPLTRRHINKEYVRNYQIKKSKSGTLTVYSKAQSPLTKALNSFIKKLSKFKQGTQQFNNMFETTSIGIDTIVDKGASLNYVDPTSGNTPLLRMIETGNPQIISFLIDRGADPNLANVYTKQTPLMRARELGFTDIAQMLIELGATDPALKSDSPVLSDEGASRNDQLIDAIKTLDSNRVKQLLDNGADPNATYFQITLTDAQQDGMIVEYPVSAQALQPNKELLQKIQNLEKRSPHTKKRTKQLITEYRQTIAQENQTKLKILEHLLNAGANPNAPIQARLFLKSKNENNLEFMRNFKKDLQQGTAPKIAFHSTELNLLGLAISLESVEMVTLLINRGARPDAHSLNAHHFLKQDIESMKLSSPLIKESFRARQTTYLNMRNVIAHSLDTLNDQINALMTAIKTGTIDQVKKLIDEGAPLNLHDEQGTPPLLLATILNKPDIATLLIKAGASVDYVSLSKPKGGLSALYMAEKMKRTALVEILGRLAAYEKLRGTVVHNQVETEQLTGGGAFVGARDIIKRNKDTIPFIINQQDEWDYTLLMLTTHIGNYDMVKLLLEQNPDPSLTNKADMTARDIAYAKGRDDLMALIDEYTEKHPEYRSRSRIKRQSPDESSSSTASTAD